MDESLHSVQLSLDWLTPKQLHMLGSQIGDIVQSGKAPQPYRRRLTG
jgi:hypothetical protein